MKFYLQKILLSLGVILALTANAHAIQSVSQINPDERVERVTVSEEGVLYAWNKYGDVVSGWPVDQSSAGRVFILPPRLQDTDYDFQDEILAVSEENDGSFRFHVFKGNGSELPFWSFAINADGSELIETPFIADVNRDGSLDIIYATSAGRIHVLRPDFSPAPNVFNLDVGGRPRISLGDPDNDGTLNIFAASGNKIYLWGENPAMPGVIGRIDFYTLPTGEEVLGNLAVADLNDDGIPEIVFTTTGNRLIVLSVIPAAPPVLNLPIPTVRATSGVLVGDVDLDGEAEVLFATNLNVLFAFNLDGTRVENFAYPLDFGQSIMPALGAVADDIYTGLLVASTGQDQTIIYRSKLGYSELTYGDYAHFFDPRADLELVDFVDIQDVVAEPFVFTPNGDGINDSVRLDYYISMNGEITLDLYDNYHRRLARLFADAPRSRGRNQEIWNGEVAPGVPVETGRYLLRIRARSPDGVVSYGEAIVIAFGVKAQIDFPSDPNESDATFPAVHGIVNVTGTATDPNIGEGNLQADFSAYKLYYRIGNWSRIDGSVAVHAGDAGSGWLPVPVPITNQSPEDIANEASDTEFPDSNVSVRAVQHGLLGSWDTTNRTVTPNGIYTILLKTIDSNGNNPEKISFDTVSVLVANPVEGDPFNSGDPYDPRNPDNPIYVGPQVTRVELSNYNLSNVNPSTAITYEIGRLSDGWGRENAHVEIAILEYNSVTRTAGRVASTFLFRNMAPGAHTLNWSGQNTVGRNLPGGDYLVRVTARATDGSGASSRDAPRPVHVERGFASSDSLRLVNDPGTGVTRFSAAPNPLFPYNFDPTTGAPETTAIHYELTKEAKVNLLVFDNHPTDNPDDHGGARILKNLRQDVISKIGTVSWDGTNDAGEILPTGRPYFVKLIAQDIALGQDDEKIAAVLELSLERSDTTPTLAARINQLVGEDNLSLINDTDPANDFPLTGSPSFFWRGRGMGYLDVNFGYEIGVMGKEIQSVPCDEPGDAGATGLYACVTYSPQGDGSGHRDFPVEVIQTAELEPSCRITTFGVDTPYEPSVPQIVNFQGDVFSGVHSSYDSSFTIHNYEYPTPLITPNRVTFIGRAGPSSNDHEECLDVDPVATEFQYYDGAAGWSETDERHFFNEVCPAIPSYYESCHDAAFGCWGAIWFKKCGTMRLNAVGEKNSEPLDWGPRNQYGSITNLRSDTHSTSTVMATHTGPFHSDSADIVDYWITGHTLQLTDFNMNGQVLSSPKTDGSLARVSVLSGWLDGNDLHVDVTPHIFRSRDHDTFIDTADNLFPAADWIYVKVAPPGINESNSRNVNLITKQTGLINIYGEYLENHLRGQAVGTNLYTFSNIVRITDWNEKELVYPDGSINDAFLRINDPRDTDANGSIDSINPREHNVKLRLRAQGLPRTFLEIRGSVGTDNYTLAYYDSHAEDPRWVPIPNAPSRARARGVLGFWDVTDLNGNNYTLRLRVTNGDNVNEDVMNVAIGTPMDFLGGRVYSTFGRASLIFQPNSLSEERLITINTVDPEREEAVDYRLPSGIAPIGPIFDIKPDDILLNPNYPVDMEITYTCEELRELLIMAPFNLNPDIACNEIDTSHLTIYNLAGDGVLEPLFTDVNYDAGQRIYRFRATLDHFSQYILSTREAGYFVIESPPKGQIQKGTIEIIGRVEDEPRSDDTVPKPLAVLDKLAISYYPAGDPSAIVNIISYDGGADPVFSIPWDASGLNGNYILLFEATGPRGLPTRFEWPVAVDNTHGDSRLIIDGQVIPDGGRVRASWNSIAEISATDNVSTGDWQSGLATIEFAWDGAGYEIYGQPFTLNFLSLGEHTIRYHTTDNRGNAEADRIATIEVAETITSGEVEGIDLNLTVGSPSYTESVQTWVSPATHISILSTRGDVEDIMYSTGDPVFAIYKGPFNFAGQEEGFYLIEYYSVDVFGVRSDLRSRKVILDRTAPTTKIALEGEFLESGGDLFVNAETRFTLEAKDGGIDPVGVDRIEYRLGEGAWQIYTVPLGITQTTNLSVRSFDRVGNEEETKIYKLRFDDVVPRIVVRNLPSVISPNGDGRFDTAEFAFTVSDNFARKLTIDIALIDDDGNRRAIFLDREMEPGDVSLVWDGRIDGDLVPEGVYTYEITIADEEGNVSEAITRPLVVDVTAPNVSITGSNVVGFSPNGDDINDVLTVNFTLSDNLFSENIQAELSILTGSEFEINRVERQFSVPPAEHNISWNGKNLQDNPSFDGGYTYQLIATDPAGNRSEPQTGESGSSEGAIVIDRYPPETRLRIAGPSSDDGGKTWIGKDARIVLEAVDPEPGAGVEGILYKFGDSAAVEYTLAIALPMENLDYMLHYWAKDLIGNEEEQKTASLRRDETPPETEYTVGGPTEELEGKVYVAPQTEISLSADDGEGVGVKDTMVRLEGTADPGDYERPVTLKGLENGPHSVYFYSIDELGNTEDEKSVIIYLDATPPVTTLTVGEPKYIDEANNIIYVTSETPISFEATAERSDLERTEYKINDGGWSEANEFNLGAEGEYVISYRSSDRLGNSESVNTQKIVVDNSAPTPTVELSQYPSGNTNYITPSTMITLGGSDNGSSVASIEYKIDDGEYAGYTKPFSLSGYESGSHTITYRIKDKLGNVSEARIFVVQLIDLLVKSETHQMPRVLAFMLQTHDLRAEDPRPNEDLINILKGEMGGYVHIISGDQNDPATVDNFLHEMRSDKYGTFILATDAYVVNFYDTEKIVNMFKELKSRIYKGDALVLLVGSSDVRGNSWYDFISDFADAGLSYSENFVGIEDKIHLVIKSYGRGFIANFDADLGRMMQDEGSETIVSGLEETIRGIMPKEDQFNKGEVEDYTVTFENHGDHEVSVHVAESYPGGFIETKTTNGEVPIDKRAFDLVVPAQSKKQVDYLYRPSASMGEYEISTDIKADWTNGLKSQSELKTSFVIENDIIGLIDKLSGYGGLITEGSMPAVEERLLMLKRRMLLAGDTINNAGADELIYPLLEAIDELKGYENISKEEIHYTLCEIVENLGALQSMKDLQSNPSVNAGDPNDPATYHGDTSSYIGDGQGGCALLRYQRGSGRLSMIVLGMLILSLFLLRLFNKRRSNPPPL